MSKRRFDKEIDSMFIYKFKFNESFSLLIQLLKPIIILLNTEFFDIT